MKRRTVLNSTSILMHEIRNSVILITLVLTFMTFLVNSIIYKVIDDHMITILDRTLVVAWAEYNKFFQETKDKFSLIRNNTDIDYIKRVIPQYTKIDFWLIVNDGEVIDSSGSSASPLANQLSALYKFTQDTREMIAASELTTLAELSQFNQEISNRYRPLDSEWTSDPQMPIIMQVVVIPLGAGDPAMHQGLIIGKILNNDHGIVDRIDQLIPGTNSTISVKNGLRISGNIKSSSHESYIGKLQKSEHIDTVYHGKRYYGQITLDDLDDKIISEPIHNSKGEIIGALTTGFPYLQFATLKRQVTLYTLIVALISFCVALLTSFALARKGSRPMVNLSTLTKEISLAEEITTDHLSRLKAIKPAELAEMRELQLSFIKMGNALFLKHQENTLYLAKLLVEQDKLNELTRELHVANLELEKRVGERTADLNKAMLELRELNRMKTKFLANMSHEIRTPLNSIIGFSDLLHEECIGDLNDKQKEYIQIILKSAELLLELINDILDMSMIDQGKLTITKQLENPNSLIRSAIMIVKALADRKQLTITTELSDDIPNIFLDPLRIKQVLYNIINNAIKFTPAGRAITVQSELRDQYVIITIADNGIGIKPELLSKVFDEFYQAEKTHEKVSDGVGLGLPLSKKLIEMHDGKLELNSTFQVGTTVVVYLPAQCRSENSFDIRLHLNE